MSTAATMRSVFRATTKSWPPPTTKSATPTVSICTTVLAFPSAVGVGLSCPPVSMISIATRISRRSRLSTIAVSQNGSTFGNLYVSVTNEAVRRSLSARGSRKAPSRVFAPRVRAM